jgi:hypothetical protein
MDDIGLIFLRLWSAAHMPSPLQMAHCGAGDIAAGAVWGICCRGAFEIT